LAEKIYKIQKDLEQKEMKRWELAGGVGGGGGGGIGPPLHPSSSGNLPPAYPSSSVLPFIGGRLL